MSVMPVTSEEWAIMPSVYPAPTGRFMRPGLVRGADGKRAQRAVRSGDPDEPWEAISHPASLTASTAAKDGSPWLKPSFSGKLSKYDVKKFRTHPG